MEPLMIPKASYVKKQKHKESKVVHSSSQASSHLDASAEAENILNLLLHEMFVHVSKGNFDLAHQLLLDDDLQELLDERQKQVNANVRAQSIKKIIPELKRLLFNALCTESLNEQAWKFLFAFMDKNVCYRYFVKTEQGFAQGIANRISVAYHEMNDKLACRMVFWYRMCTLPVEELIKTNVCGRAVQAAFKHQDPNDEDHHRTLDAVLFLTGTDVGAVAVACGFQNYGARLLLSQAKIKTPGALDGVMRACSLEKGAKAIVSQNGSRLLGNILLEMRAEDDVECVWKCMQQIVHHCPQERPKVARIIAIAALDPNKSANQAALQALQVIIAKEEHILSPSIGNIRETEQNHINQTKVQAKALIAKVMQEFKLSIPRRKESARFQVYMNALALLCHGNAVRFLVDAEIPQFFAQHLVKLFQNRMMGRLYASQIILYLCDTNDSAFRTFLEAGGVQALIAVVLSENNENIKRSAEFVNLCAALAISLRRIKNMGLPLREEERVQLIKAALNITRICVQLEKGSYLPLGPLKLLEVTLASNEEYHTPEVVRVLECAVQAVTRALQSPRDAVNSFLCTREGAADAINLMYVMLTRIPRSEFMFNELKEQLILASRRVRNASLVCHAISEGASEKDLEILANALCAFVGTTEPWSTPLVCEAVHELGRQEEFLQVLKQKGAQQLLIDKLRAKYLQNNSSDASLIHDDTALLDIMLAIGGAAVANYEYTTFAQCLMEAFRHNAPNENSIKEVQNLTSNSQISL